VSAERNQRLPVGGGARRVGLMLRPERDLRAQLTEIELWAKDAGVTLVGVAGDERLPTSVEQAPESAVACNCDVVLALGGDGTVLAALRVAAPHAVPVLGVNLGRLGYLAEVDPEHLNRALGAVAQGNYFVEGRSGLVLTPVSGSEMPITRAFNDVVLNRIPGRGQAALELRVDDELLVRYSSDGVIVATAQGRPRTRLPLGGRWCPRAREG
jgi:NAD+ kinase